MNEFYILMGSNINPDDNIKLGIKEIESHAGLTIVEKSSFYESEPYGMEGDNFLNLVLNIQTNNNFSELLKILKLIESRCGRVRDPVNKFTPRTLDLDIIDWTGFSGEIDGYQLPDPEIEKRDFIKKPYYEIKK
tara:strand:+ start:26185 stop:26586 length:402 start_codon:yes stop_codon:yes gene_type:complete